MSQQNVGQGPGNLVPDSEFKMFLAGAAITKGQCVSLKTGDGTASYTVVLADSNSTPVQPAIGVAPEAIASGAWGKIIVSGYAPQVLSGGSVAAGDYLIPIRLRVLPLAVLWAPTTGCSSASPCRRTLVRRCSAMRSSTSGSKDVR